VRGNLSFLLTYIKRHAWSYSFGLAFVVVTNLILVIIPRYIQKSIDLVDSGGKDLLYHYLGILLLLSVSMILIRTLSRILFFNPGRAIECEVKNALFKKLMDLPRSYYEKHPVGEIVSKLNNDISGVRIICGFGMLQIFNVFTSLTFTPISMWQMSPELTIYCMLPLFIVFIVVKYGMNFLVSHSKGRTVKLQTLSSFIVSSIGGIDVSRQYGLQGWLEKKFDLYNQQLLGHSLGISRIRSFVLPILKSLENILKVVVLSVGGYFVLNQQFTLGQLTAYLSYTALLSFPLMGLGWLTTMFQQGMVGVESVRSILKTDVPFRLNAPLKTSECNRLFDEGINIHNLSYSYAEKTVLNNISFSIKPGDVIGVLGRVGSGKTTLVNCLNRYLSVSDGMVSIGNKEINQFTNSDLRQGIRTVSQDSFLFSDSIKNNILFGKKGGLSSGTKKLLEKAIYQSALSTDVDRFKDGIETMVGEKGIMLSGGQKQRINIAQGLIDSCKLLILDNIFSAVDFETQHFLIEQIMMSDYAESLLIVSHRTQALERANLILVIDDGHIVDRGTHDELIERAGYYRDTYELQKVGTQE
jgi:ATP-binding cassette, subfamily B, multidrug efflux pump